MEMEKGNLQKVEVKSLLLYIYCDNIYSLKKNFV